MAETAWPAATSAGLPARSAALMVPAPVAIIGSSWPSM